MSLYPTTVFVLALLGRGSELGTGSELGVKGSPIGFEKVSGCRFYLNRSDAEGALKMMDPYVVSSFSIQECVIMGDSEYMELLPTEDDDDPWAMGGV